MICQIPDTEIYQCILQHVNFRPDMVCYASFGRNYDYCPITDQDIINKLQKQLNILHTSLI